MKRTTRDSFVTVSEDGIRYVHITTESGSYNVLEERGDKKILWLTPLAFFGMILKVAQVSIKEDSNPMTRMKQVLSGAGIISDHIEPHAKVFSRFSDKPVFPIRLNAESIIRVHYMWWEYLIPISHFWEESLHFLGSSDVPVYIADFSSEFKMAFLNKFKS